MDLGEAEKSFSELFNVTELECAITYVPKPTTFFFFFSVTQ